MVLVLRKSAGSALSGSVLWYDRGQARRVGGRARIRAPHLGNRTPCQRASCASVDRRPHPRDLRCGDSKPGHARSTALGARLLALGRRRSGARPASCTRRSSPGCEEGLSTSVGTRATGTGHRAWRSRHSRPCLAARVQSDSGTCKTESHYRTGGHGLTRLQYPALHHQHTVTSRTAGHQQNSRISTMSCSPLSSSARTSGTELRVLGAGKVLARIKPFASTTQ